MGTLVDTSVLIAAQRSELDLRKAIAADGGDAVALATISASELLHGPHRMTNAVARARVERQVEHLIAQFTMMTITTVAGGKKGAPAAPVPAAAPFPLPFEDNFDETTYAYDAMAHYFSDQFGSFAVRNGSLAQVAWKNPGKLAWSGDTDPFT